MKKINYKHFQFAAIIGIGFWKQIYLGEHDLYGTVYSFVFPFMIIRIGHMEVKKIKKYK